MAIRMKHPKHGFTHAYNTVDKTYLEGLGWSAEEVKTESEMEVATRQYTEKFGKKPHHMTKLENILKAINDDGK